MRRFTADFNYHQFYVADRELEPDAPTNWTDADVEAHFLTADHIVALGTEAHIDADIFSCGPEDEIPDFPDPHDFEVRVSVDFPSGKIGIYGWPWEIADQHDVAPGRHDILFRGYVINRPDEGDYYCVKIMPKTKD